MTQEVFDSSTTWTAPEGVTSVDVECWGTGGNGANTGGGGGGGAYSKTLGYAVTPANNYAIVIQSGSGLTTHFDASAVVAANGVNANSPTGALGGSAASGVGTTLFSGGNGADNDIPNGGGGGSSAGSVANGNNGSGTSGGAELTDGAAGGDGGIGVGSVGSNGNAPGGGGGGGGEQGALGLGGPGRVRLTYEAAAPGEESAVTIMAQYLLFD